MVSGIEFNWELNKFGLGVLLNLRIFWKLLISINLVSQYEDFFFVVLCRLDVKNVLLDFRSDLKLMKDKQMS